MSTILPADFTVVAFRRLKRECPLVSPMAYKVPRPPRSNATFVVDTAGTPDVTDTTVRVVRFAKLPLAGSVALWDGLSTYRDGGLWDARADPTGAPASTPLVVEGGLSTFSQQDFLGIIFSYSFVGVPRGPFIFVTSCGGFGAQF